MTDHPVEMTPAGIVEFWRAAGPRKWFMKDPAFDVAIREMGGEFKQVYLTMGAHDMVAIVEGPDDEAMAKVALGLGSSGAIRTTTLRAFSEATYRKLIDAI